MVMPMVATADADEPEIAPNIAEEIMVTTPRPPLNRPTMEFANSTILLESPDAVIRPPAKIKKGIAINTKELRFEKIAGIANPGSISRKNIMAKPPNPKETNRGKPAMIMRMVSAMRVMRSITKNLLYKKR
jgi:hypothetical protein